MATKTKYIIEGENRTDHLFNELDRDVRSFDRRMQGIQSTGIAVGAALAAAFGGAKLVGALREFGSLTASLETVTGSGQAAQEALAWIEPFAATTPFQLEQIIGAFVKLEARGLKPSEAALRSYGNTASAMGKSLDQFVEAVADATTGEFERLLDFGIKASTEGERVTFRFRGMSQTVQKEAAAIEEYLRRIGDVDFAGATTRRAETLDGALSNLEDSATALLRAMGDAGLTQVVADGARAMSVLASNMADAVREGDGLLRVFEGLGSGIAALTRGSDQQALGQVELDIMELEQQIIDLEKRRGLTDRDRSTRIGLIQQEIDALERQRKGLLAVLQPEEFGAAPRTTSAAPGAGETGSTGGGAVDSAFEKDVKAFEKLMRATAGLERDFQRDFALLLEDQARGADELTEKLRFSQEERLEDLSRALLTERERIQIEMTERLQLVRVAREQELDATMEYAELEKRIREDAAKEIAALEKEELDKAAEAQKEHFERLTRAVQGWGDDATEAILNFATGAKGSFSDMVDSILRDIARIAIRRAIVDPLGDALFGGEDGGGGLLGSLFSGLLPTGSRATGGPAFRGQPLVVGEQGRELFVPSTTGSIVPVGGGGTNVKIEVINSSGASVDVRPGQTVDGEERIKIFIGQAVRDELANGGLDRALSQDFGVSRQGVNR